MKRGELKKQIETILREIPQSRDNDIYLTIKIWTKYFPRVIQGEIPNRYVFLKDIMNLPTQDNVKRIRAHFQNDLNKYLPTTWLIAKQRRINEDVWYKFARTGRLN